MSLLPCLTEVMLYFSHLIRKKAFYVSSKASFEKLFYFGGTPKRLSLAPQKSDFQSRWGLWEVGDTLRGEL